MLITTIAEMQAVIPTIVGDDFDLYSTYVDEAEAWISQTILGSTLYGKVVANKTVAGYLSLVKYCRMVIAMKAYHRAIPFLDLVQTNNGFAVTNTPNMAPASKDRVRALRDEVIVRMYASIEILIKYLDENKTTFTDWASSPSYSTRYDLLIYSAKEFQNHVNIFESHWTYLTLVPSMKEVEDRYLHPTVSKDLVDDIKTKVKAGTTLTAAYAAIYPDLKKAEANLSLSVAIEQLAVQVTPEGVNVAYVIGQSSYSDTNRNESLIRQYKERGLLYLNKVQQYILNHLTDFTKYTDSDIYDDQEAGYLGFENAEDDAIFSGGI